MKILQINSIYPVKSTGRIVKELEDIQREQGYEPYVACGQSTVKKDNVYTIGTPFYNKLSILKTRLFGKHGFYNRRATKKLLKWVDSIKPDIIHLHNIHGHYLNVKLLFEYIKKHNIPVVWTLHDCWSFTGHCAHFDLIGCNKWKTGCFDCPAKHQYPISKIFDRSKGNYAAKKELFSGLDKLHIVTPSKWLENLCKESFLGNYPVSVLHNGIETDTFTFTQSNIKKELGIEDKFVILGIVKDFKTYKGGKDFLKLSEMISDDEVIVLLSLEEKPEDIPANIIPLKRTSDDKLLSKIYSMADVFVNPTMQDTFPTVNIEAISCSTPVVTYNSGGSAESQCEGTGFVVEKGDIKGIYDAVLRVKNGEISRENCRKRGLEFKTKDCFSKYTEIYRTILK